MSTQIDEVDSAESSAMRNTISAIAGWLGLLLLLGTVGYFAVTGQFDLPARILLIAAFLALTAYVWLNPEAIAAIVTGRGTRNILSTMIIVVLGIALVVAINWLYGLLAPRVAGEFGRVDMTAGQSLTLSQQSINAVRNLPGPTTAVGFFREDSFGLQQRREAENLLREYTKYNPELRVEWVNPDIDPFRANQYGITRVNVVVFDSIQRHESATSIGETEFTGALLRLQSNVQKTVAFLNVPSLLSFQGATADAAAASLARTGLETENYIILPPINVVVSPTISVSDVTVLIVPPSLPERPLSDAEVRTIVDYLDKGGHVLLIGDPLAAPMPAAILSKYGLAESRSIVVEQNPSNVWSNSPLNIVVFNYPASTVTRDMTNVPTIYRAAGIIQPPTSTITGFVATTILSSSPNAIAARFVEDAAGGEGAGQLEQDPSVPPGAQSLAVSVEQQVPGADATGGATDAPRPNATRLVVINDADWITDELMGQPVGNRDLFNNMVNWLSQSEERISVRPRDTTDRQMFLTAEQKNLIAWTTIVFLPLLALVGGGVVWWRRR